MYLEQCTYIALPETFIRRHLPVHRLLTSILCAFIIILYYYNIMYYYYLLLYVVLHVEVYAHATAAAVATGTNGRYRIVLIAASHGWCSTPYKLFENFVFYIFAIFLHSLCTVLGISCSENNKSISTAIYFAYTILISVVLHSYAFII